MDDAGIYRRPDNSTFEVRDPYYPAGCDKCGWSGSSEDCGTDSWGDDSDVYCPKCQSGGADYGVVASASVLIVKGTEFDAWIDNLKEEVIEGEYGYEPDEFTVYPEHWRTMFNEGLTPSAAFRRACEARTAARHAIGSQEGGNG